MSRTTTWSGRLSCLAACGVILSAGTAEAGWVWGGVYGWGRPTGTVKYVDKSLERVDLPGVDGQYGELIYDNGGLDPAYSLKAQAVLETDTLQSSIAISNHVAAPTIQSLDAWTNAFNADTYTVTGGTPGDEVEAIFTCSISGSMTIQPLTDTDPNTYGTASFNIGMHGTYGDPAIIPNWIDAGMFIRYYQNTIEILSNDLYIYDDWDDDTYDLDRHTPIASALVEGQDYTLSGNTVTLHASFAFPVTMVSGHALSVESELDLAADTADYYWYPARAVDVTADFWNTGITGIALAPAYQDVYSIERSSGVPEPATLVPLLLGSLLLTKRRRIIH